MIHICIYSFYKDSFLQNCLNSINESSYQDYFIDLYIYSEQIEVNILELKQISKIEINVLNKRKSFAEISNISIAKATERQHSFFMLLNSDTLLEKKALSLLVETFSLKNNIGVVGGFQTAFDGEWNEPNLWTKNALKDNYSSEKIIKHQQEFTLYKYDYVQGACMLMKMSIFDEVDLFDERFVFFYEETELCRRIRNKFYDIVILEEAKVKHFSGGTWKKNMLFQYRRDVLYLTNQIIFESTENSTTKKQLVLKVFSIIQKQIKNLWHKTDNHRLPVIFYPFILFNLIYKSNFLRNLFQKQSAFLLQQNG